MFIGLGLVAAAVIGFVAGMNTVRRRRTSGSNDLSETMID